MKTCSDSGGKVVPFERVKESNPSDQEPDRRPDFLSSGSMMISFCGVAGDRFRHLRN